MDGGGDELLAGAGFAAEEGDGVGGGDLVDGAVDFSHGVGVSDDIFGAVLVFEGVSEADVFVFELFVAGLFFPAVFDVVGDEAGDDGEDADVFVEGGDFFEESVDGEGADNFLADSDGDADEGDFIFGEGGLSTLSVEEEGVQGDFRDDHGFSGLDDAACDAFADAVLEASAVFVGEVVCDFDGEFVGVGFEQDDGAACHAEVVVEGVEDVGEGLLLVLGLGEDAGDFVEGLEFEDVALVMGGGVGFLCHHGVSWGVYKVTNMLARIWEMTRVFILGGEEFWVIWCARYS